MSKPEAIFYSPTLRLKDGELRAVDQLASDLAQHVLPRFIVLPRGEREGSTLIPQLTEIPDVGPVLARYWPKRNVLIDITYVIDEFDREKMQYWLVKMFDRARSREVKLIPTLQLADTDVTELVALRKVISEGAEGGIKLAISIAFELIGSIETKTKLDRVLSFLSLVPSDCVVVADYTTADFTTPAIVAPIIVETLGVLQAIGRWSNVIFSGTSFPEVNTVAPGSKEFFPRGEWQAWSRAVGSDPLIAEQLIFGDYAADSAKIIFGGRGRAIRHLRYATPVGWILQRGKCDDGPVGSIIREVCQALLDSGGYAGPDFSHADMEIYNKACGLDPRAGTPSVWRQLNTTHHITRVVTDIASVRGITIGRGRLPVVQSRLNL